MPIREARWAHLVAWVAWHALLGGCGDPSSDAANCVTAHAAPIYFGTPEPARLELSVAQRSAIGTVTPKSDGAICTGVLIQERWVLTAAHCDDGEALTFRSSMPLAQPVVARSTVVHPALDVLLLELSDPAPPGLSPIPLFEGDVTPEWVGRELTLAGVGQTESGSVGSLLFAHEPVVDVSELEITVDGMGRSGACVGDSGGPILIAAEDGSPRVAGTLDRGSSSCTGMDLYVRVDRFRSWVNEATGTRDCDAR